MRPVWVAFLNARFGTTVFTYLVPNYVIMFAIATTIAALRAAARTRRLHLDASVMYGMCLWAIPAGLAGARLWTWLVLPPAERGGLAGLLDPLAVGLTEYGGYAGGVTAAFLYLRRTGPLFWRYVDAAVPEVVTAAGLVRLGCFLDGDDFGAPTTSVLAVRFPAGSPAHEVHRLHGLVPADAAWSLPVHPVQIYFSLACLAIAVVGTRWVRRPTAAPGETFWVVAGLFAVMRFLLEFLRGDVPARVFGLLTDAQLTSVAVALAAAAALRRPQAP